MRPDWHEYFLQGAQWASTRSTCPRLRVGVLVVKDRRIIATGYNGAPSGMDHCDDVGCAIENGGCVRTIHAEANAIVQCARLGIETQGAVLYCTHAPCVECAKIIINAGISHVIYDRLYRSSRGLELLGNAGIQVTMFPILGD